MIARVRESVPHIRKGLQRMFSMPLTFRSYGSERYSWKGNRKTAGKWRKSMPTTQNANSVITNWG